MKANAVKKWLSCYGNTDTFSRVSLTIVDNWDTLRVVKKDPMNHK